MFDSTRMLVMKNRQCQHNEGESSNIVFSAWFMSWIPHSFRNIQLVELLSAVDADSFGQRAVAIVFEISRGKKNIAKLIRSLYPSRFQIHSHCVYARRCVCIFQRNEQQTINKIVDWAECLWHTQYDSGSILPLTFGQTEERPDYFDYICCFLIH